VYTDWHREKETGNRCREFFQRLSPEDLTGKKGDVFTCGGCLN